MGADRNWKDPVPWLFLGSCVLRRLEHPLEEKKWSNVCQVYQHFWETSSHQMGFGYGELRHRVSSVASNHRVFYSLCCQAPPLHENTYTTDPAWVSSDFALTINLLQQAVALELICICSQHAPQQGCWSQSCACLLYYHYILACLLIQLAQGG